MEREDKTDLQELLLDGPKQVEPRLDLGLGVRRLHGGRHHRHKPALAGHLEETEKMNMAASV